MAGQALVAAGRTVTRGRVHSLHAYFLRPGDPTVPILTAATEMLRGGASLGEVGQVLRHASVLTTAIYAKVDRDGLRALALPWPGRSS